MYFKKHCFDFCRRSYIKEEETFEKKELYFKILKKKRLLEKEELHG